MSYSPRCLAFSFDRVSRNSCSPVHRPAERISSFFLPRNSIPYQWKKYFLFSPVATIFLYPVKSTSLPTAVKATLQNRIPSICHIPGNDILSFLSLYLILSRLSIRAMPTCDNASQKTGSASNCNSFTFCLGSLVKYIRGKNRIPTHSVSTRMNYHNESPICLCHTSATRRFFVSLLPVVSSTTLLRVTTL